MRLITGTGLAVAAAAVAMAVGLGTAAYADGQDEILIITTDDTEQVDTAQNGTGAATRWDCPGSDSTEPSVPAGSPADTAGSL